MGLIYYYDNEQDVYCKSDVMCCARNLCNDAED